MEKIYYINVSWKELYGDDVDKVMDECGECDEEEISTLEDDAWRMYVGFKDNILPSGTKAVEVSEIDLSKDGLYISSSEIGRGYEVVYDGVVVFEYFEPMD